MFVGLVLAILAVPMVFVGLIDPLEGGLALLLALALGFGARVLTRVPVPRLAWIPMVVSIGVGALTLVLVAIAMPDAADSPQTGPEAAAPNPESVGVRLLSWGYRLGVLVTLIGAIVYVAHIVRQLRQADARAGVPERRGAGA